MQPDGKLVLKGESPSADRSHIASGIVGSNLFAVGITELAKPLAPSSAFRSSDLKDLYVGIYQAANGRKLTAMTISDPLPSVQTFALSPDGRHMAILKPDQIALYALPMLSIPPSDPGGQ